MKKVIYLSIMFLMISLTISAQASGGQITHKRTNTTERSQKQSQRVKPRSNQAKPSSSSHNVAKKSVAKKEAGVAQDSRYSPSSSTERIKARKLSSHRATTEESSHTSTNSGRSTAHESRNTTRDYESRTRTYENVEQTHNSDYNVSFAGDRKRMYFSFDGKNFDDRTDFRLAPGTHTIYVRCKGENELISSIQVDGGQNNYYVSFKKRIIEKRPSGVTSGNKQATLSSSQSLNNVTFVSDRNTIYLSFDGRNFDTKREY